MSNRPLGTNVNEIFIGNHIFSFKKVLLKMSSGKWRPFCATIWRWIIIYRLSRWFCVLQRSGNLHAFKKSRNVVWIISLNLSFKWHKTQNLKSRIGLQLPLCNILKLISEIWQYLKMTAVKETHLTNEDVTIRSRHIAMFHIGYLTTGCVWRVRWRNHILPNTKLQYQNDC